MKKILCIALASCMLFAAAAYAEDIPADERTPVSAESVSAEVDSTASEVISATIKLSDDGITIDGTGAEAEDNRLIINAPGTYSITGNLSNGSILVDCTDSGITDKKVTLQLNGVDITCQDGPAIQCIYTPKRLSLSAVEGTVNTLSDTSRIDDEGNDIPTSVIFSKSDLTITGDGTLNINANNKSGIVSKDDIRIKGNVILNISATGHGISGKDSVDILGGIITITAGKDGIRSMGDIDNTKGFITMSDGSLDITCEDDPIKATHDFTLTGGTVSFHMIESDE